MFRSLAAEYISERSVSRKYVDAIAAVCRELDEFGVQRFDATELNRWLAGLESKWKPATVQKKKTIIGTLWRYAHDRGLAEPIGRLRNQGPPH